MEIQTIASPAISGSKLPRLGKLPNGAILMSWVEPKNAGHALKFGVQQDGRWLKQGEVAHGDNWFVNWADFPSVVAIDENFWVAHWLVKQKGGKTYDYDIVLAISNDAGISWREIGHPHQDKGVAAEHGFVTIFADAEAAGIVWLDGREYIKKEDKATGSNETGLSEKSGNFNLRYTRIHRDGSLDAERVLDDNTCTCCWTSVASTPQGAIAAWRGRTDDEIRDNRIALLRDGKWSKPIDLGAEGWEIDGCPVNGPAVAARGMQVAAAWFTAEGGRPRVKASFSTDGGATFGNPIEVDIDAPMGRIGLVWKDSQTAVVSWMTAPDTLTKESDFSLRTVSVGGKLGAIYHAAKLAAGREVGVPQIAATNQGLVVAWTDNLSGLSVHTAIVDWNALQSSAALKFASDANNATPFIAAICGRTH